MAIIEDVEFMLKSGYSYYLDIDGLRVQVSFEKPFFHLNVKDVRRDEEVYTDIRSFNSIQGLDEELYKMLGTVLYQRRYNEWKVVLNEYMR